MRSQQNSEGRTGPLSPPGVSSVALASRRSGNPALPRLLALALLSLATAGCRAKAPDPSPSTVAVPAAPAATAAPVPTYGYEVVATHPHDPEAFTQGLIYLKGILLESTGLNGRSSLRKVDLETGRVRQEIDLSSEFFAEGLTVLGDKLFQLTWQNQKGFVYDLTTLEKQQEFAYDGEGWGLTTDGASLILSDGTDRIRFLDAATFKVTRTISVLDHAGQPLRGLNELEYIRGEIYANIWQTPYVARIDPATGRLLGVIDFSGLLAPADRRPNTDVLNGIAYDAAGDRLFVTGKNWPKLFEVRLKSN